MLTFVTVAFYMVQARKEEQEAIEEGERRVRAKRQVDFSFDFASLPISNLLGGAIGAYTHAHQRQGASCARVLDQ